MREAAAQVVDERGPTGLSLRELARTLGVSPNAPYRHFKDLDALLNEVAADGFDELRRRLLEAPTGPGQIAEIGRAYLDYAWEHPGLYRLMFSRRIPASGHQGLQRSAERAWHVLLEAVRAEGHEGDAADQRALVLWSSVHGYALLSLDGLVGGACPTGPVDVAWMLAGLGAEGREGAPGRTPEG